MSTRGDKGTRVRRQEPSRRLPTAFHHALVRTAKTEAEMAAGRQAVVRRHPVRRMADFSAEELTALRGKLLRYVARHQGLPALTGLDHDHFAEEGDV